MNPLSSDIIHATAIRVRVPAATALAFLADVKELHRWALTQHDVEARGANIVSATDRFSGQTTLVRIDADQTRKLVDYQLGGDEASLTTRIMARVIAHAALRNESHACTISLHAWRTAEMDDERWRRLIAAHEWEIVLLRSLLEAEQEQ